MNSHKDEKLRMPEIIGYGVGDLACNLIFQAGAIFLLFFYTDVFGLSAYEAGLLFLIARVWDAVNDPLMGYLIDRTNTRIGKFRPFILWGSLPLAVLGALCFYSPDLSHTGKLVYAYVTYIGVGMMFTLVNVPYGAMTASMTLDSVERTTLSASRMVFAIIGALIVVGGMPFLVDKLGQGDAAWGYQIAATIFSFFVVVLLFITFKTARERFVYEPEVKLQVREIPRIFFKNIPLVVLCLLFLVAFGIEAIMNSGMLYFFTYNLNRADLFPLYGLVFVVPMILVSPLVPALSKRYGKKRLYIVGLWISLVSPIAILLVSTENLAIIFIAKGISGIGYGFLNVLVWALMPDTVEYGEYATGKRTEGMVYSIIGFFFKVGLALGGMVPGLVLGLTGYVANATQTPLALSGIESLQTWLPIAFTIAGLIIIRFYDLDEDKHREITEQLQAKLSPVERPIAAV